MARPNYKLIRAHFIGKQAWRYGAFPLYNLLEPMADYPAHSTVSLNTMHLNGYHPIE